MLKSLLKRLLQTAIPNHEICIAIDGAHCKNDLIAALPYSCIATNWCQQNHPSFF